MAGEGRILVTDFRRLASAFDVIVRDLEMKLAAVTAAAAAHQAEMSELRLLLDRPEMMGGTGYAEGVRRLVRTELEVKRLEPELARLRAERGAAQGKRDKCLERAKQAEALQERQEEENALIELMSLRNDASLAQSGND